MICVVGDPTVDMTNALWYFAKTTALIVALVVVLLWIGNAVLNR